MKGMVGIGNETPGGHPLASISSLCLVCSFFAADQWWWEALFSDWLCWVGYLFRTNKTSLESALCLIREYHIYYLLKRNCWGTLTLMIYGRTWHPLTLVLALLAFLSGPGTGKGFEDRSSCQTIAPYALWKPKQLIGGNNWTTLLRYYTSRSGRLETDVVLLGQCQWELYIKYKI